MFHQMHWPVKQYSKPQAVLGKATFEGEQVDIIDALPPCRGSISVLINYGGPQWVDLDELKNVVWGY